MNSDEKKILEEKLKAKELIIDNLIKINLSIDEDRKSILEEAYRTYPYKDNNNNG